MRLMRMYFCSRAGGIKGITLAAKRSSRWPASFLPMIYSFMCLTPLVGTIIDDLLERGKGYLRLLAREGGETGQTLPTGYQPALSAKMFIPAALEREITHQAFQPTVSCSVSSKKSSRAVSVCR